MNLEELLTEIFVFACVIAALWLYFRLNRGPKVPRTKDPAQLLKNRNALEKKIDALIWRHIVSKADGAVGQVDPDDLVIPLHQAAMIEDYSEDYVEIVAMILRRLAAVETVLAARYDKAGESAKIVNRRAELLEQDAAGLEALDGAGRKARQKAFKEQFEATSDLPDAAHNDILYLYNDGDIPELNTDDKTLRAERKRVAVVRRQT
jgi:hypothetical protein